MIRLANDKTKPDVYRMWEICFNDSPTFMDLYFNGKYKNENTLVYIESNKVVGSIQLLPYQFTFYGTEIPIAYISGACTLPEYRNRGYMGKLLSASFQLMQQRNIPLSLLIPAEDWLYAYYAKYGYETVFEPNDSVIPLQEIIKLSNGDIDKAYSLFDKLYRSQDFCIQKTKSDFITIIQDVESEGFPPKTNLSGMARIIDTGKLLSYFSKAYRHKPLLLKVEDNALKDNSANYSIDKGICKKTTDNESSLQLNINILCKLLFGFHLEELPNELTSYFEPHQPILNLMLE